MVPGCFPGLHRGLLGLVAVPLLRRVIRRLLLVLTLCSAALLRAQPAAQPTLTADRTEIDYARNETVFVGHAELRDADALLTADRIRFNSATNVATATGHVVYTRGSLRVLADRVVVHRADRTFTAEHVRLGSYPYYVEGASATGTAGAVTVKQARIWYGEPGPWQPSASAASLTLAPGNRIVSENAQVGIGPIRPLPFPKFQQSLTADSLLSTVSLTGGYRGSLGAYLDGGLHLPVWPGVRLGADLGYYTSRGLMIGPSGTYTDPSDPSRLQGSFSSGYINDHGDKGVDLLGRPVPANRAFIQWRHQQQVTDHLSVKGELNWWKDSEVLRDFRPRSFFPVQQPDTYAEATYAGSNYFLSLFTRLRPNSFQIVQQRLPEIRFDLLPLALPHGFYERFNASIAALVEQPLPGAPPVPAAGGAAGASVSAYPLLTDTFGGAIYPAATATYGDPYAGSAAHELRSTRFDAYYALMRPIAPNPWLTVTPVVGGRLTDYEDTLGAMKNGSYTRALGEVGADAEMRLSGTFAYRNPKWHIDGLRHLFTPRISYRYIPEAGRGQAYIPPIDREAFSTYLQPLDLGDVRNIDTLHATNTLRLELDNTLQTRDPRGGSRDLLRFNAAEDFRFLRQPGQQNASEIQTELAVMPTRWLTFGVYDSFSPQTFTMRELNTGITLHDGRAWTVQFGNNFLRHQLQDFLLDGRYRLTEEFDAVTRLRYDQRRHRFTEQSYGLVENLANTWRISYLVSFYTGRLRESHFGLSVQVDTVRF